MDSEKINLIIIDEDPEELELLGKYLNNRFTNCVEICTISRKEIVTQYLHQNINIIVIRYGENNFGMYVLNSGDTTNQNKETIQLTNRNEIGMAVELIHNILHSEIGNTKGLKNIATTFYNVISFWL